MAGFSFGYRESFPSSVIAAVALGLLEANFELLGLVHF